MIEVGFAKPGEAEAATAVMREAAAWAAGLHHFYWTEAQLDLAQTAAHIASAEQICARREGRVVGLPGWSRKTGYSGRIARAARPSTSTSSLSFATWQALACPTP